MSGEVARAALKGAAAEIAGVAEQAELFGLPVADEDGRVAEAIAKGSKGGRPKGAQNLATRELRDYLLKRGVLPQQAMMQWALLGVEGMAVALACSKAEAFDRWFALARELGRYFMAPMVPVDDQGKAAPTFLVQIGGRAGVTGASGEQLPPWAYLDVEQNQALSADAASAPKEDEATP